MIKKWIAIIIAIGVLGCAGLAAELSLRVIVPKRKIIVTDESGHPIHDFDLYVYRCTLPGSRFDRVFLKLRQRGPEIQLERATEWGNIQAGFRKVTSDFYVPLKPEPYWIACINKPGFKSRRWSMDRNQGDPLKISLAAGADTGPDWCTANGHGCNPCRSYEYHFYSNMRFDNCH